jgi:hypothetical protein
LLEELAMLRGAALASLALLLTGSGAASAQVAAGGLGTRVNGTALGRCSVGVCSVQGGSAAGANLFHRFSQFETRSGIQRVDLDSGGRINVVGGEPSGGQLLQRPPAAQRRQPPACCSPPPPVCASAAARSTPWAGWRIGWGRERTPPRWTSKPWPMAAWRATPWAGATGRSCLPAVA